MMKPVLLFGLAVLGSGVSAAAVEAEAADCLRLAGEVEANLRQHVLGVWFPRSLDREHGGYHEDFAADWTPLPRHDKSLVCQARLVWTAACAALRDPVRREEFAAWSNHGASFLRDKMWDREHGGFFWRVDGAGRPTAALGAVKSSYGNAFGIYAAVAHHRLTGDQGSLCLAQETFRWLERHAHDPSHGGYFEDCARDGTPLPAGAEGGPAAAKGALGIPHGWKTMNSHIHLLEAFTALHGVWPDPLVRERLRELLLLVRDKIAVPPGALNLFFTPDWRPLPDHDSYGHDVETAFLLIEAARALDGKADAATAEVARRLVDHALDYGWDAEHGGFHDAGGVFGPVSKPDKVWWVQAEGLNALLLMHRQFGADTGRYWEAFRRQWQFIEDHQTDRVHGGWFAVVAASGEARPGAPKGDGWTECYHQARALMQTGEALREMARGAKR